jgi:hypothetical protein
MLINEQAEQVEKQTKVNGYNDWYQEQWDYNRRLKLYEEVSKAGKT